MVFKSGRMSTVTKVVMFITRLFILITLYHCYNNKVNGRTYKLMDYNLRSCADYASYPTAIGIVSQLANISLPQMQTWTQQIIAELDATSSFPKHLQRRKFLRFIYPKLECSTEASLARNLYHQFGMSLVVFKELSRTFERLKWNQTGSLRVQQQHFADYLDHLADGNHAARCHAEKWLVKLEVRNYYRNTYHSKFPLYCLKYVSTPLCLDLLNMLANSWNLALNYVNARLNVHLSSHQLSVN